MVGKEKNDCGHRVGNPRLKPYAFISLHCLFAILVFHFFIQRAIGVCGVNGQYAQKLADQEFNPELVTATTQNFLSMEPHVHSLNFKINLVAAIIVSVLLKIIVIEKN